MSVRRNLSEREPAECENNYAFFFLVVSIVSDKLNFGLLMAASFLLGVILTSIVCCYRVKSTRRRGQKESQIMCGHGGGQQPPNQMTHVYQTHPISPPMAYGSPPPAYQSPFRPTNDPFVIQNAHFDRSMSVPYEPTFYSDPRMVSHWDES